MVVPIFHFWNKHIVVPWLVGWLEPWLVKSLLSYAGGDSLCLYPSKSGPMNKHIVKHIVPVLSTNISWNIPQRGNYRAYRKAVGWLVGWLGNRSSYVVRSTPLARSGPFP